MRIAMATTIAALSAIFGLNFFIATDPTQKFLFVSGAMLLIATFVLYIAFTSRPDPE